MEKHLKNTMLPEFVQKKTKSFQLEECHGSSFPDIGLPRHDLSAIFSTVDSSDETGVFQFRLPAEQAWDCRPSDNL